MVFFGNWVNKADGTVITAYKVAK